MYCCAYSCDGIEAYILTDPDGRMVENPFDSIIADPGCRIAIEWYQDPGDCWSVIIMSLPCCANKHSEAQEWSECSTVVWYEMDWLWKNVFKVISKWKNGLSSSCCSRCTSCRSSIQSSGTKSLGYCKVGHVFFAFHILSIQSKCKAAVWYQAHSFQNFEDVIFRDARFQRRQVWGTSGLKDVRFEGRQVWGTSGLKDGRFEGCRVWGTLGLRDVGFKGHQV